MNWQKVENAPKDGRDVLACFVGQFDKIVVFMAKANPDKVYAPGYANPTHWSPMPNKESLEL